MRFRVETLLDFVTGFYTIYKALTALQMARNRNVTKLLRKAPEEKINWNNLQGDGSFFKRDLRIQIQKLNTRYHYFPDPVEASHKPVQTMEYFQGDQK